jgi:hypothetical protein
VRPTGRRAGGERTSSPPPRPGRQSPSGRLVPARDARIACAICRHVVAARRVAQLIVAAEKARRLNLDHYNKLLTMQGRETHALATLAVKMRLSQSATMRPETAHKGDLIDDPPWEFGC